MDEDRPVAAEGQFYFLFSQCYFNRFTVQICRGGGMRGPPPGRYGGGGGGDRWGGGGGGSRGGGGGGYGGGGGRDWDRGPPMRGPPGRGPPMDYGGGGPPPFGAPPSGGPQQTTQVRLRTAAFVLTLSHSPVEKRLPFLFHLCKPPPPGQPFNN